MEPDDLDEALDHAEELLANAAERARSELVEVPPFEPDQHWRLSCAAHAATRK